MTEGYARISTKWCDKHRPPPSNFRQRIRKWLHKSYQAKQGGSRCDCPSVTINVSGPGPSTYLRGLVLGDPDD